jgi:[pyruvate, water dikinase]-phosphate phosphotransferase / [pyruvate, water dikinase] kinase
MRQIHFHLVSDSTGETVSSVARAAIAQYEGIDVREHVWSLIRTPSQLEKILSQIKNHPGPVLYTLVDHVLRETLKSECLKLEIPCIPVLAPVIRELSAYLQQETAALPGKQYEMNEQYFSRVEAINFTLAHDDGQAPWDADEADIILVGCSRTSKSPTCVYLAYRGFRAANLPFVPGTVVPKAILEAKRPLIVGLTINAERLVEIRKSRLQTLNQEEKGHYIDLEQVVEEINEAKKFFRQQKWPVIDVTRRSVEETAATVIQYFHQRSGNGN